MPESTLFKKKLWHSCFSVSFAKFLRTPSLQNTSGRLPLFLPDSIHQYYIGQRGGCRFKETFDEKDFLWVYKRKTYECIFYQCYLFRS